MSVTKLCETCGAIDKATFATQNCPECNSPNFILDYDEAIRGMEKPAADYEAEALDNLSYKADFEIASSLAI